MKKQINHKALYEGFQNTPMLWETDELYSLKQFRILNTEAHFIPKLMYKPLRLGKWIEAYTSFQLRKQTGIEILQENIKINREKQTIGELDVLFMNNDQPVHLEIAYKFYLYDGTKAYENALAPWIGPNRNDSLLYKINKLKEKQLPLLYKKESTEVLNKLELNPKDIQQYVCFKAQLFVPFHQTRIDITPLNSLCIAGSYLSYNSLDELKNYLFYIPDKLDWLRTPHSSVEWLDFKEAKSVINDYIDSKRSPMCWIKDSSVIQKCFITWW